MTVAQRVHECLGCHAKGWLVVGALPWWLGFLQGLGLCWFGGGGGKHSLPAAQKQLGFGWRWPMRIRA